MSDAATHTRTDAIRFLLNGKAVTVDDVSPTESVLCYLREKQRLTGTKEGCAEGDCGACTVVIAELTKDDELELKTVNACIQFVPTLDGKALFTVEHLRRADGNLHPVQQAMVEHHGSQCGFCTPGFIMSLWNTYNEAQAAGTRPSEQQVRSALTGNLCRCTGYRPILEAAAKMFDLPPVDLDRGAIRQQLLDLRRDASFAYDHEGKRFFAPKSLQELVALRAENPGATILAGCTDIGLWVNKQFRELDPIIYIGEVRELRQIGSSGDSLRISAGVSLTDAQRAISPHYPQMDEMWERFASIPIRNAGTLGGNVANGSPIGDSMPALIALGTKVVLNSVRGQRTMPLEELYVEYMKKAMEPDEIVEAIELPLPTPAQQFRCYKLSKRYDSDISAVFAAFAITLEGQQLVHSRVAYGGMAATPKRAPQCEQALTGKVWNETTAREAMQALTEDYTPMTDMRASKQNRMQSAQNLLYRFYLETRPDNPLPVESLNAFAVA